MADDDKSPETDHEIAADAADRDDEDFQLRDDLLDRIHAAIEDEGVGNSEGVSETSTEDDLPMEWVDVCVSVSNRFGNDSAERVGKVFPALARLFEVLTAKPERQRNHAREKPISGPVTQPGEVTDADLFEADFF